MPRKMVGSQKIGRLVRGALRSSKAWACEEDGKAKAWEQKAVYSDVVLSILD